MSSLQGISSLNWFWSQETPAKHKNLNKISVLWVNLGAFSVEITWIRNITRKTLHQDATRLGFFACIMCGNFRWNRSREIILQNACGTHLILGHLQWILGQIHKSRPRFIICTNQDSWKSQDSLKEFTINNTHQPILIQVLMFWKLWSTFCQKYKVQVCFRKSILYSIFFNSLTKSFSL